MAVMEVHLDIAGLYRLAPFLIALAVCSIMTSVFYNAQNLGLQQPVKLLSTL